MDRQLLKASLEFIKQTLEALTRASVKSLKAHSYKVELDRTDVTVKNFPKPPKVQDVKVTNQQDVNTHLERVQTAIEKLNRSVIERQVVKEIRVSNLKEIPKSPEKVTVTNQPTSIAVSNLETVLRALRDLTDSVKKLPTSYPETKIPDFPTIPDFPEIPDYPTEIRVNNLEDIKDDDPKKYVPVRLTDGKRFYAAIEDLIVGSSGKYAFMRPDGAKGQARMDSSNRLEMGGSARFTTNDIIADGDYRYECMETSDGEWLVMRIDTGTNRQFRYATITNNVDIETYEEAFTGYADLTYGTVSQAL